MPLTTKQYYVYVLQNQTAKHYIGLTENLHQRLAQHNAGLSKWTRAKGPWRLVWHIGPMSLSEARKLENLLKRQKTGTGFYAITGLQPPGS